MHKHVKIAKTFYLFSVFSPLATIVTGFFLVSMAGIIIGTLGEPTRVNQYYIIDVVLYLGAFILLFLFVFCILVAPYIVAGYMIFPLLFSETGNNRQTDKYPVLLFCILFLMGLAFNLLFMSNPGELVSDSFNIKDYNSSVTIARLITLGCVVIGGGIATGACFQFSKYQFYFCNITKTFHIVIFFIFYMPFYLISYLFLSDTIYVHVFGGNIPW